MIPTQISCGYMLSFSGAPVTQTALLTSLKKERSIARYAARVAECTSASLIIPRLYLANYRIAADEEELTELGITHVVSVVEYPPDYSGDHHIKTLHIKVEDTFSSPLIDYLPSTTEFIRGALEENETNKVLVRPSHSLSARRRLTKIMNFCTENRYIA